MRMVANALGELNVAEATCPDCITYIVLNMCSPLSPVLAAQQMPVHVMFSILLAIFLCCTCIQK